MIAFRIWALLLVGCWSHSLRSSLSDAVHLEAVTGRGDGFDVSGAGDARVNGRYAPVDGHYDTYGGRPMYRPVDASGKPILTAGEIYNQGGTWLIRHEGTPGSLYVGEGETPESATWAVGPAGQPPVPTVGLAAPARAEEPKPEAEEAAPVTTAAPTATTTAAATAEPLETEELFGLGKFVGIRLLIFCIILAIVTCCVMGCCILPRDDGDTYTVQIDHSFGHKLGMEFEWKVGGLTLLSISEEESLAHHFNERHSDASSDPCHIEVGHVLIEVNGIRNDEKKMRAELARPKLLMLVFRRPHSEETARDQSQEVPDLLETSEAEPSTPDKRVSAKGGGSTGGGSNKSQQELDDAMAKRRAAEELHGIGSMADKSTFDDETTAALARRRAKHDSMEDIGTIASQAQITSGVQPELAARLARQRQNEDASPKATITRK